MLTQLFNLQFVVVAYFDFVQKNDFFSEITCVK